VFLVKVDDIIKKAELLKLSSSAISKNQTALFPQPGYDGAAYVIASDPF
jgi:hypothetical protein